jgi:thiol-disulfide isomerase/thioredoxin
VSNLWILIVFAPWMMMAQQRTRPVESPFQSVAPAISDTLAFRASLADFEAKDVSGRTWRVKNFQGKLTVVVIWSTWCLPCRQEQPELQQFYEQTKSSKNIQVVTFSLDKDPAVTWAYMDQKGYTFPVIVDPKLAQSLFPMDGGIPATWVIDRQGRRCEPFRAWKLGRILIEVEREAARS